MHQQRVLPILQHQRRDNFYPRHAAVRLSSEHYVVRVVVVPTGLDSPTYQSPVLSGSLIQAHYGSRASRQCDLVGCAPLVQAVDLPETQSQTDQRYQAKAREQEGTAME
jgi:hypothetical protein